MGGAGARAGPRVGVGHEGHVPSLSHAPEVLVEGVARGHGGLGGPLVDEHGVHGLGALGAHDAFHVAQDGRVAAVGEEHLVLHVVLELVDRLLPERTHRPLVFRDAHVPHDHQARRPLGTAVADVEEPLLITTQVLHRDQAADDEEPVLVVEPALLLCQIGPERVCGAGGRGGAAGSRAASDVIVTPARSGVSSRSGCGCWIGHTGFRRFVQLSLFGSLQVGLQNADSMHDVVGELFECGRSY